MKKTQLDKTIGGLSATSLVRLSNSIKTKQLNTNSKVGNATLKKINKELKSRDSLRSILKSRWEENADTKSSNKYDKDSIKRISYYEEYKFKINRLKDNTPKYRKVALWTK